LMSGFLLVPVNGGNPVPVPPGETLLGRGPLLRTHANPCFIQASLSSEPRPLPRGSWSTLRDGELLSLLPGRLVFRVEAVGGEECTSRYSRSVWAAASSAPLLFEAGIKQTEEDLQLMKSCSCRSCLTSLCPPAGASGVPRRRSSFPPQEKVRRVQQERRGRSQTGDHDRWVPRPHRYVRPCAEASGRKRETNRRCPAFDLHRPTWRLRGTPLCLRSGFEYFLPG
uniref:PNK FHA domain-containing protein n=1 Tax=Oryzias sinensis TaxID=183150 RepID=A0A8C7X0S0_9TELE